MITKRTGHGQTICKGCKEKGKFGLNWDSFLYNFNGEPYCFECLMETLEIYQDRIDKAIEYMKPRFMNCIDNEKRYFEDYDIQQIYEILKGDKNEC